MRLMNSASQAIKAEAASSEAPGLTARKTTAPVRTAFPYTTDTRNAIYGQERFPLPTPDSIRARQTTAAPIPRRLGKENIFLSITISSFCAIRPKK